MLSSRLFAASRLPPVVVVCLFVVLTRLSCVAPLLWFSWFSCLSGALWVFVQGVLAHAAPLCLHCPWPPFGVASGRRRPLSGAERFRPSPRFAPFSCLRLSGVPHRARPGFVLALGFPFSANLDRWGCGEVVFWGSIWRHRGWSPLVVPGWPAAWVRCCGSLVSVWRLVLAFIAPFCGVSAAACCLVCFLF